ncbi:phage tail assembly protein [Salinisphaera sp. USBA-960]|nr:phage tail assembly protein [Salifodinibacter halophilus]NNC25294.1 phage tail assembly protein [Salifodinibacter halophilus]
MSDESATSADAADTQSATAETITLDTPIQRGKSSIETITLRKPGAGELRGVALTDVLRMDVDALTSVVPRISQPVLTKSEVQGLDPADLVQCGSAVAGFLLTKAAQADATPS